MTGQSGDIIRAMRRRASRIFDFCIMAFCVLAVMLAAGVVRVRERAADFTRPEDAIHLGLVLAGSLAFVALVIAYRRSNEPLERYDRAENTLVALLRADRSEYIRNEFDALARRSRHDPFVRGLMDDRRDAIMNHLASVMAAEAQERETRRKLAEIAAAEEMAARDEKVRETRLAALTKAFEDVSRACVDHIEARYRDSPVCQVERLFTEALTIARKNRIDAEANWNTKLHGMSWWQQLNTEGPDLAAMDKQIAEIEAAQRRFLRSGKSARNRAHFDVVKDRAKARHLQCLLPAYQTLPSSHLERYDEKMIAKSALWLAAMSIPVSAWVDITRASDIYDCLREVNGNYAGMSDIDIWMDALMMPSESLAGLASLTKGAWFEKLVESDLGGERFEHFNHPDADIVVDGIAYQLKATDSESYIDSVADGIPVIATSEVAAATNVIDGGYANADLNESVDLALGGPGIDIDDTAIDALLAGVGCLGTLAMLRGFNHVSEKIRNGGDREEAVLEGIGVAVTGTAKAFVDTAELGYKALNSRPSRFLGRMVVKAATKLDEKLSGN